MLLVSLIQSVFLLFIVIAFARRSGAIKLLALTAGCGFCCGLGPAFLAMSLFPAVALQTLLLFIAALGMGISGRGARYFVPASIGLTLLSYVLVGCGALVAVNGLRERYPYVSLEEHLPAMKPTAGPSLTPSVARRLDALEATLVEETEKNPSFHRRVEYLRNLHENVVAAFIDSPGFGQGRLLHFAGGGLLYDYDHPPSPQPGPTPELVWSISELQAPPPQEPETEPILDQLHRDGVRQFIDPKGFGYIKDLRHVAGFQDHRLKYAPWSLEDQAWKIRSMQLVGLALHDDPVVYVSNNLPRMKELREASTRTLDLFESLGLEALQGGEDLFIRDTKSGRRMFGAVRAIKQCFTCHGCQRGELLGAFSYTLQRETPDEPRSPEWPRKTVRR